MTKKTDDKSTIISTIRIVIGSTPAEDLKTKAYFEGLAALTWVELLDEIESETALGKSFVKRISSAAKAQGVDLYDYLMANSS